MYTAEQIEETRLKLEHEHGRKVYAHVFLNENEEQIVGYLKDPDRLVKMRALDMGAQSWTSAADVLLQTSLLKEHSDKRILDDNGDDKIYLSFLMKANDLVKFYAEQKKS